MNTTPKESPGYMLLFRGTGWNDCGLSADEMQAVLGKVMDWFGDLEKSGKSISAEPLMAGGRLITATSDHSLMDGPFSETKESIGGYLRLRVDTLEEAVEIAKSNPGLPYGMVTEVREVASQCPVMKHLEEMKLAIA